MKRDVKKEIFISNNQFCKSNAIYHKFSKLFNVSDSESQILYFLMFENEISIQDMIFYTCLPKQTMNSTLRNMEKKEWITLKNLDSKSKLICLTDKGRKETEESAEKMVKIEEEVFSSIDEEEVKNYLSFLNKYNEGLEKILKEMEEK